MKIEIHFGFSLYDQPRSDGVERVSDDRSDTPGRKTGREVHPPQTDTAQLGGVGQHPRRYRVKQRKLEGSEGNGEDLSCRVSLPQSDPAFVLDDVGETLENAFVDPVGAFQRNRFCLNLKRIVNIYELTE